MISKLRKWFDSSREPGQADDKAESLQLCVAVLLVEIARADHDHNESENRKIQEQLIEKFGLSGNEAAEMIAKATHAAENSISLHDYTKTLHSNMSYKEKESVIEMLWQIALADQNLDKYEDYMLGKIAELLYVSRGDVIRLKHHVIESIS